MTDMLIEGTKKLLEDEIVKLFLDGINLNFSSEDFKVKQEPSDQTAIWKAYLERNFGYQGKEELLRRTKAKLSVSISDSSRFSQEDIERVLAENGAFMKLLIYQESEFNPLYRIEMSTKSESASVSGDSKFIKQAYGLVYQNEPSD